QNDEQNSDQEPWNRISYDDRPRGPHVEMRAVAYRFAYPQRNGDEISQEREPEPERDGDRKLLLDELENRGIAKIALAKIEPRVVPQHQQETLIGRLVEP